MLLTMPPSTATTERSFSVLKLNLKLTRHNGTGNIIGLGIATYSQRHLASIGNSCRQV